MKFRVFWTGQTLILMEFDKIHDILLCFDIPEKSAHIFWPYFMGLDQNRPQNQLLRDNITLVGPGDIDFDQIWTYFKQYKPIS